MNLLKTAVKIAETSRKERFRHGVIVIKGGAIVATGSNGRERHAEVVALNKLWPSKRWGCSIISIRIRIDGSIGMARPCTECRKYLIANQVIKIWYTDAKGMMQMERL